jgi:16S rRNA (cytidine1402-2'-O)-methyltransferase
MPAVYLIPSLLDEKGIDSLPAYLLNAVKDCQVLFVENERTSRRFLKHLWKEIVIDSYEWHTIHKAEKAVQSIFRERLREGKNIGIISEAGCPGIADPGQLLVAVGHELNADIRPLVGPSSILLAVMASGMNGQKFQFNGYLPIDNQERAKTLSELESESLKKQCTQVFIETPYRNNQMLEIILKTCRPTTQLCLAANLTGEKEWIKTRSIAEWKKERIDLHKQPVIFVLYAGEKNG